MFGEIGFAELLVVAALIIILTKPEDLPVIMRRAGLMYAYVHMYLQGVWLGWQEKLGLLNAPGPRKGDDA
ncbi:MAG: hypothetical protein DI628_02970 [Blastochloris viridis]|uniref:Twin-arginine translocation protein TatB n=1 Tax=Blastochloris viridis TaxID=1079 RepID=A0A6N4RC67_BLAVI|nr:MAG: hypothetical protein DI628_02970 [Blastochloris viridis]